MALLFGPNPAPSLNKRTCMTASSLWTPPGGFSACRRWTNCTAWYSDDEIWGACGFGCRLSLRRTGFDPGLVLSRKYHWDMFLSLCSLSRSVPTPPTRSFIYRGSYVILPIEGVVILDAWRQQDRYTRYWKLISILTVLMYKLHGYTVHQQCWTLFITNWCT